MRGKAQRESARRAASPDFTGSGLTIARPPQSHNASACQVSAQSSGSLWQAELTFIPFFGYPK